MGKLKTAGQLQFQIQHRVHTGLAAEILPLVSVGTKEEKML